MTTNIFNKFSREEKDNTQVREYKSVFDEMECEEKEIQVVWVLKHSQYKRALKIAKVHELDSLKIDLLKLRFDLNKQIVTEKDSLIAAYSRGYERYLKLWEETSIKLEEAEVKAVKRFRNGLIAGTIVTAVVGALFAK